jgi:hypothetical protein
VEISPKSKSGPAARLRLLADWFDMYDSADRASRVRLLTDPRSPGRHGVSADLRAIAASLPWSPSASGPGASELKMLALWFEGRWPGRLLDETPGPHGSDVQRDLRAIAGRLETARRAN